MREEESDLETVVSKGIKLSKSPVSDEAGSEGISSSGSAEKCLDGTHNRTVCIDEELS